MNTIDFEKDIYDSIESPRLHHQLLPNIAVFESDYDKRIVDQLVAKGHEVIESNDIANRQMLIFI